MHCGRARTFMQHGHTGRESAAAVAETRCALTSRGSPDRFNRMRILAALFSGLLLAACSEKPSPPMEPLKPTPPAPPQAPAASPDPKPPSTPPPGELRSIHCGLLTPEDLKFAGVAHVLETTCMKGLHLMAINGTESGYGSLTLVVDLETEPRAKGAYDDDVGTYKDAGPAGSFKEENAFGEKSYFWKLGDQFILGFLNGKYYFKFGGAAGVRYTLKESESVARKLAKSCAGHLK